MDSKLEEKFQNTYNLVFRPHHIKGESKFKVLGSANDKNTDYEYLLFNYIMELHERHGYD